MNGLRPVLNKPTSLSPLIGILYAEDFDDIPDGSPVGDPAPDEADQSPPPLTQDDLDRACEAAVIAARLEWERESEQLRNDLLGAIGKNLTDAHETAEQIASNTAEAAVMTMLAMLSGALPSLCEEHGPAEARAIVDHLLPTLRAEPRIIVRVHPEMADDLRQDLADLQPNHSGTLTVLPTGVERGDVTIEWENGALSRDTRQILQAMQDALGLLGLQQPRETAPKRRLAHAG